MFPDYFQNKWKQPKHLTEETKQEFSHIKRCVDWLTVYLPTKLFRIKVHSNFHQKMSMEYNWCHKQGSQLVSNADE